jgi:hypothetical protein
VKITACLQLLRYNVALRLVLPFTVSGKYHWTWFSEYAFDQTQFFMAFVNVFLIPAYFGSENSFGHKCILVSALGIVDMDTK